MFGEVNEAGLVAAVEEAVRAEAAAGALRLAAIGELTARRVETMTNARSGRAIRGTRRPRRWLRR
ncbi:MAG: hypothetical protein ACXWZ0_10210 [Mycobacterium sp.]